MNKSQNGKYNQLATVFWKNVAYVLKEKRISWKSLAEKLNVDARTLSSRKACNSNVSLGMAKDIAEAIGTGVDRLIYGRPDKD